MSVGCCIVASDTAPVKEFIQNEHNGILTDFYDIQSLVSIINRILDDQKSYLTFGTHAREYIKNNYDKSVALKLQIQLTMQIWNMT